MTTKTTTRFANRFATAERESDGTWTVFNEVTGLLQREGLTFSAAQVAVIEMGQHYRAIEREG